MAFIVAALASNWPHSLFETKENSLVRHAFWVYYMTKYIELMDTVFMILRHRQRQMSLLHVSIPFRVVINIIALLKQFLLHQLPRPQAPLG